MKRQSIISIALHISSAMPRFGAGSACVVLKARLRPCDGNTASALFPTRQRWQPIAERGRIEKMNIRKMCCCVFHPVGDGSLGRRRRLHHSFLHPVRDASLRDAVFRGCIRFLPSDAILTDCAGTLADCNNRKIRN
jgi:hypothetical protein